MKVTGLYRTILLFVLLMGMGSVFSVLYPGVVDILLFALSFTGAIVLHKTISKKVFAAVLWLFVVFAISSILTHTAIIKYIGVLIRALSVPFIFSVFDNNPQLLKQSLIKVLKIVSYLAVINYLLIIILPDLFVSVQTSNGYMVNTVFCLFNYLTGIDIFSLFFYRNQGIFWEPGLLQIPMNFLIYHYLIENGNSIKSILIPVFVIITTFSTTGMLIMMFIIVVYFFKGAVRFSFSKGVIIGLMTLSIGYLSYENFQEKFSGGGTGSAAARTYDYLMGWQIAKSHPLFGIGIDRESYLAQTKDLDMAFFEDVNLDSERSNSNTFLLVFTSFGIPLGLLFIYLLYKQIIFERKKIFFLLLFVSLFSEPLFGTSFLFIFLFSSLLERHVLVKRQRILSASVTTK